MKYSILTALILAASASVASANSDLATKAQMDHPGVTAFGSTVNPTGSFDDRSLTAKAMKDHPGVTSKGNTLNPTAKPDDRSLTAKAMKDHPGVRG